VVVVMVFECGMGAAKAEVALIAVRAAKRAHEKDGVKEMLEESFSFGLVVLVAAAVRANMRLTEDRHGLLLSFLPGDKYRTPKSAVVEH
jgi:hypothetical protein